jgi:3-deoxy-D-manno-octulosonic-acid transferase
VIAVFIQGNACIPHSQGIVEFHATKVIRLVGKNKIGWTHSTCIVEQKIFKMLIKVLNVLNPHQSTTITTITTTTTTTTTTSSAPDT